MAEIPEIELFRVDQANGDSKLVRSLHRPKIGKEEIEATRRVLESGWLTQGPEVQAFEREFASYVRSKTACAVSSGTAALIFALEAAGVKPGDEVITVSYSFIATANSIFALGAKPVFVDIEPETFNMDATQVEKKISKKTKAILAVHQFGIPCDLHVLLEAAKTHRIPLIEDAACAIGSEIKIKGEWQKIGRPEGNFACFSFHPRKLLTTGEGGMITYRDSTADQFFRRSRHQGMNISDHERHQQNKVQIEDYPNFGINARLTDIQAAIGRVQLGRLDEIIASREKRVEWYRKRLEIKNYFHLPKIPEWAKSNWQSLPIWIPDSVSQTSLMQKLLDQNIATKAGIRCAHLQKTYADGQSDLKISEKAQNHSILLPLHHELEESDVDEIVKNLEAAIEPK